MIRKKKCVAMLLAGGQGSRLYALTNNIAKPAVSFGGKYRIIDFPLSNCVNSGIDTVGILAQYQPLLMNEYIGNGQPWDLDRTFGGVHILSPYQGKHSSDWYKGTANAIYQNIHFIKQYNPDYVLILSGDHIYKMDYSRMLEAHIKAGAACTVAAIEVPMKEASRFGIINADKDGTITGFEEKPAHPKSNLASMGIYVFTAEKLYSYLEKDAKKPDSENDFGKNVLPDMLTSGEKMTAYVFDGYWKDVGTIDSLYEANMDLLGDVPKIDVTDKKWKIQSRNPLMQPQYLGKGSKVINSIVMSGSEIWGEVDNSVLSSGVIVKKGAKVKDSIIMANTVIEEGAIVNYSIIDENTEIGPKAKIGEKKSDSVKIALLGRNIKVEAGAVVPQGAIVDKDVVKEVK
ncbi:MAG TPA: glucose-1-phosphate adenylyltransferase [Clostridiales bacterium]|nr:glucose-1-phosphate adenylyltransferase [Clostridiales bacterium]